MDIGKKIRHLRLDQDLNQEGLAKEADVDITTISRIERGVNNDFSFSTISKIADALKVSVTWLLDEEQGYPPPERVEKRRERRKKQEV